MKGVNLWNFALFEVFCWSLH